MCFMKIRGLPTAPAPPRFRGMEPSESQFMQYVPVLMLAVVAMLFSVGMVVVSALVGKRARRTAIKDTAYECGMLPAGRGGARFSVKFHLVAMLFILFDIEVVFLYPWAVNFKSMIGRQPGLILGGMAGFMLVLFIGYLYALKKDAFDWKQ